MTENHWELIDEVFGMGQAELLHGLLEAQGVAPVMLTQEGAGRAYGFTIGKMGQVQILVPSHLAEQARKVLEDYYAGDFADRGPAVDPRNDVDGESDL
jgi:hypothetical protein